jgi:hypothetical protein
LYIFLIRQPASSTRDVQLHVSNAVNLKGYPVDWEKTQKNSGAQLT